MKNVKFEQYLERVMTTELEDFITDYKLEIVNYNYFKEEMNLYQIIGEGKWENFVNALDLNVFEMIKELAEYEIYDINNYEDLFNAYVAMGIEEKCYDFYVKKCKELVAMNIEEVPFELFNILF